jgi:hypothetical protein
VLQQRFEQTDIDAIDLAGVLMIDPLEDAGRMGDQGVGAGAAQIGSGQTFEDFMGDAVGGVEGKLECGVIGDAGAVEIAGGLAGLLGEAAHLVARPMHQGHLDAEAAQQGDVEQQVAEIVVLDDAAVESDDKGFVAVLRHVPQDFAQVGQSQHRSWSPH